MGKWLEEVMSEIRRRSGDDVLDDGGIEKVLALVREVLADEELERPVESDMDRRLRLAIKRVAARMLEEAELKKRVQGKEPEPLDRFAASYSAAKRMPGSGRRRRGDGAR